MATFSVESGRSVEYPGNVYFTVRLSEPQTYDVTVDYATWSGTAIVGTDVSKTIRTLEFDAGEVEKTFYINGYNDSVAEPDESFILELFNPVGADFAGRTLTLRTAGWLLDDEPGSGARSLAVIAPVVSESASQATFTISLSEAFSSTTTLDFATVPGSADAGSDFIGRSGTVTFVAGQTEAEVTVALKSDSVVEPGETFGLKVSGAGLAGFGQATIVNDDGRTPILTLETDRSSEYPGNVYFTARLSEASTSAVTVQYATHSGSAISGTDFGPASQTITFAAGQTEKVFYVNGYNDSLSERDEYFGIELVNPVGASFGGGNLALRRHGWFLDDDAGGGQRSLAVAAPVVEEGGGKATFTLSLSEAFASDTTMHFQTVAGSGRSGSDFAARTGTITFAAGQTEATVGVTLKNDRVSESAETFGLKVTGGGLAAFGEAKILDADATRPVLTLQADRSTEYPGNVYFTARLSEASRSTVTVDYQTVNGTAIAGTDFGVSSSTLTFAAGETVKRFYINGYNDSTSEPDEAFGVSFSNPVGASFGPGLRGLTATGWLLDDEPGTEKRAIKVDDVTVSEDSGFAHFTISVSRPLDDDVTIRFKTESESAKAQKDFVSGTGRVTLLQGATETVVSIRLKDNGVRENAETFKLKITGFDHRDDFASSGLDLIGVARILDDDSGRSAAHLDSLF